MAISASRDLPRQSTVSEYGNNNISRTATVPVNLSHAIIKYTNTDK